MPLAFFGFTRILEDNLRARREYEADLARFGAVAAKRLKGERRLQRIAVNNAKALKFARFMAMISFPLAVLWFVLSTLGGGPAQGLIIALIIEALVWISGYVVVRIKAHNPYVD